MRHHRKETLIGNGSLAIICLGVAGLISDGEINRSLYVTLVTMAIPFSALAFMIVGSLWDDYAQELTINMRSILNALILGAVFFVVNSLVSTLTGSPEAGRLFGGVWIIGSTFGILVLRIQS